MARATARRALAQLVNWGLAEARKGSGVYVRVNEMTADSSAYVFRYEFDRR